MCYCATVVVPMGECFMKGNQFMVINGTCLFTSCLMCAVTEPTNGITSIYYARSDCTYDVLLQRSLDRMKNLQTQNLWPRNSSTV